MKISPADIWEYPIPKVGNFSFLFLGKTLDEIQHTMRRLNQQVLLVAHQRKVTVNQVAKIVAQRTLKKHLTGLKSP